MALTSEEVQHLVITRTKHISNVTASCTVSAYSFREKQNVLGLHSLSSFHELANVFRKGLF